MTPMGAGQTLQLRGERAPFVMLPRWLLYHPGVGEGAKFLYCVLHDLVAGREGPTRPVTRAELAACCAVSVDTIDRRLAQLVAAAAVEKHTQVRAGGQSRQRLPGVADPTRRPPPHPPSTTRRPQPRNCGPG